MAKQVGLAKAWRDLSGAVPGIRKRLVVVVAAGFLGGLAEAAALVLVARLALAVSSGSSFIGIYGRHSLANGPAALVALGAVIAKLAFTTVGAKATTSAMGLALNRERHSLMAAFLASGWPSQSRWSLGDLQELVTTHVDRTGQLVSAIAGFATASLNLLVFLAVAVGVNVQAAALTVGVGVLMSFALRPLAAGVRRAAREQSASGRTFAARVTEVARTAREIDVFHGQAIVLRDVDALSGAHVGHQRRTAILGILTPQIYQAGALAAIIGGIAILDHTDGASLTAVGPVALLLLRSVSYGQQLQTSVHNLNVVRPFLDTIAAQRAELEAAAPHYGEREVEADRAIVFRDVTFSYGDGPPVLDHLSLELSEGETLGVIGPSGSGKSTLLQVLLRLRPPTGGEVLLGDVPIHEFSPESWARYVAFVPQEPQLFAGSVAENIAFFRPFDRADIEAAAVAAGLHDEIAALPGGYDERIAPDTRALSGGQQQRLCIARALVGRPGLLVLDEPTSALDVQSERRVQETLHRLRGSLTLVIVAHRLTTVAACDRVIVLAGGQVQASGRHDELLARSPYYGEVLRLSHIAV